MASYRELLQQVKAEINEVDASEARALLEDAPPAVVDVREQDEWDEGHLPAAVHIPRGNLESRIENAVPDHFPSRFRARLRPRSAAGTAATSSSRRSARMASRGSSTRGSS